MKSNKVKETRNPELGIKTSTLHFASSVEEEQVKSVDKVEGKSKIY